MKKIKGNKRSRIILVYFLASLVILLGIRLPYFNWFIAWQIVILIIVNWVLFLHFYKPKVDVLFYAFIGTLFVNAIGQLIGVETDKLGVVLLVEILSMLYLLAQNE